MSKENNCESSSTDSEDYDFSPSQDSSSESEDEETVEINGIQIHASQENLYEEMFKRHNLFDIKNEQLNNAYMDVLLDLIETLGLTEELSMDDLDKAESTLFDLSRAGLNVGWLRQKLDVEKQRVSGALIRELEEEVRKRKLTLSDLESDLEKAKAAAALASKDRIGFSDVV